MRWFIKRCLEKSKPTMTTRRSARSLRRRATAPRRTPGASPASTRTRSGDWTTTATAITTYNELGEPKTSQYIANNLNQYTSRTIPGYAAVRGHADADATVTVNENATYRYGEYFFGSDEFDNSTAPVDAALVTTAALASPTNGPDEVASVTSRVHIAKTPQHFEYDDGNLLNDGYYTFTYDSANRLEKVSTNGVLVLTNIYDAKSRRVRKTRGGTDPTAYSCYFIWQEVADNIYQTYKEKCGKCEEAELEVRHEKRYRPYDESKYNDCIESCLKMLPTGRQDGFPFFNAFVNAWVSSIR